MLARGRTDPDLEDMARRRGIAVERCERLDLERSARSTAHQGVVAVTDAFRYAPLEELLGPDVESVLVLDSVQDPHNLGAIVRAARAAGIQGVVMSRDRSASVTSAVVAASTGHVFGVAVARVTNLVRAMEELRQAGLWLVGLVPRGATSIFAADLPRRLGLVLGGEGDGLRALVRRTCDFEVEIPMAAGVESLNVAVAAGVAVYEVRRRRSPS